MADERVERKLAAILAADVAGYSRLSGEDEAGTRAQFGRDVRKYRASSGVRYVAGSGVGCKLSAVR